MIKEGYVEKVIYKNDDNGYAVFTVECEDGEDIFVGTLHGISEGIYISAEGEYVNHPQYDLQFKFTSYEIKMPDDMVSVERYSRWILCVSLKKSRNDWQRSRVSRSGKQERSQSLIMKRKRCRMRSFF